MDLEICNLKCKRRKEQRTFGTSGKQDCRLKPNVSIIALNVSKQVKGRDCQSGYKRKT